MHSVKEGPLATACAQVCHPVLPKEQWTYEELGRSRKWEQAPFLLKVRKELAHLLPQWQ